MLSGGRTNSCLQAPRKCRILPVNQTQGSPTPLKVLSPRILRTTSTRSVRLESDTPILRKTGSETFNPKGGFVMTDKENRKYQMFVRVRNFCTAHTADFAANSLGAQLAAALVAVIARLDDLIGAQSSGRGAAREGSSSRAAARAAL